MKRHLVIATAAAAALVAGGTVTAVAVSNNDGAGSARSGAQISAQPAAQNSGAQGAGTEGTGAQGAAQGGRSSIRMQDDDANGREDIREANAAKVTAPDAAAAALKAVPGTVAGLDLDADRPGLVWDADVLGKDGKWHEITLDAGTARVLNQHIEHEDDDSGQLRDDLKAAKTDASTAARTAAASYGTVTSVELDDDHRAKAVWEVETVTKDGKEHKLLVDPQSGRLSVAAARGADD
ncbi:PepSY domain-containing protein [Streptomyces inhibens]|uniref:PepSY domain-containing protein n=1 Tax=Streptomyces inhibens TaxID=2293571 RepID=UPI001EE76ED5|nr:PepSY domain-containing protein [Streptomyces inhibens]UKY52725.1 PepSY domain-containing protein [Streptomyces inhibens]